MEFQDFSIAEIVYSYEGLSEKSKEKIAFLATEKFREEGITSFDEQYRYIAYLVEKFQWRWSDRGALRLDASIDIRGRETLSSFIEARDPNLAPLLQEDEYKEALDMEQIFSMLEKEMDEGTINFLRQLRGKQNRRIRIYSEDLITSVPRIKACLWQIRHKYERNGLLVLPVRPIRDVRFVDEKLTIKFGHREWKNQDPLLFYQEHKEIYGSLSRSELYGFDSGLFTALWKSRKLEHAIPELQRRSDKFLRAMKKRRLHSQRKIVEAYKACDGIATKAVDKTGYSKHTVLKHWNDAGLESRDPRFIPDEKVKRIYEAHRLGMTLQETTEYAGVVMGTVSRYWQKKGLKAHANRSLPPEKVERIVRATKSGKSLKQTAKYAGVCMATVGTYRRKLKLKSRDHRGRKRGMHS